MKPIRKKIGSVLYNHHKFPVWLDNSIALQVVTIKIHDNGKIPHHEISMTGFCEKYLGRDAHIVEYVTMDIDNLKDRLSALLNWFDAQIDYKKVDDFILKIDKQVVVNRLGGK